MLRLWPGVGLVVANMIGAGVLLSTGFMAQDLGPGAILGAWAIGAVMALAGARAYGALVEIIPRSGGEYRFLFDLLHPAVGYAAGWTSLLVGFSAPIAVDAIAAGSFAQTLWPQLDPRWGATILVLVLTGLHAFRLRSSHWTQNALVVLKAFLVVGFVVVGVVAGRHAWPTWHPPQPTHRFPLAAFCSSLFYIAFAFSGWNAAVYVADEFEEPRRTVPRAMLIGCALVGSLYLLVNWVFVANLDPQQASAVFAYESQRITLGHLIMKRVIGELGAQVMSIVAIALFLSATSAMIFVGPRIYAAMATDGLLPSVFRAEGSRPPAGSIALQGALSIALIFTHRVQQVLLNVGAVLTLSAAVTAASLFRIRFGRVGLPRPSAGALVAAAFYVGSALVILAFGVRDSPLLAAWIGAILLISAITYRVHAKRARVA